jgi:hypothetical protein
LLTLLILAPVSECFGAALPLIIALKLRRSKSKEKGTVFSRALAALPDGGMPRLRLPANLKISPAAVIDPDSSPIKTPTAALSA